MVDAQLCKLSEFSFARTVRMSCCFRYIFSRKRPPPYIYYIDIDILGGRVNGEDCWR